MANSVNITPLLDGPRHVIIQVYLANDGYSGELSNEVLYKICPETDPTVSRLTVEEVLFHFAGFDAKLTFDTGQVDKSVIWVLPEGAANHVDFRPFGGFKDRSGLDGTGTLLISTNGFTNNNAQGSVLIKLRKD